MKTRRRISDLLGDEPAKRGPGRPPKASSERLNNARAEKLELETAKLRGELLDRNEVARQWQTGLADVRAHMLTVASRIGARLSLDAKAMKIVDAEIREALGDLADKGARHAQRKR